MESESKGRVELAKTRRAGIEVEVWGTSISGSASSFLARSPRARLAPSPRQPSTVCRSL